MTRRAPAPLSALVTAALAVLLALLLPAGSGADAAPARAARATGGPHGCAQAPDRIVLPRGFQPEGIARTPHGRFFVGSLVGAGIRTGQLDRDRHSRPAFDVAASLRGLLFDARTGWLWAVGTAAGGSGDGVVLVLDPSTGRRVATVRVPDARFLNDLTFTAGRAYVTDSLRRALWVLPRRLHEPPDRVTKLKLSAAIPPVPAGGQIALNGIRTLADGSLIVVDYRDGSLYRIDPADGTARLVPVHGSEPVTSGDGLVLGTPRTLYVVRGQGNDDFLRVRLHGPPAHLTGTSNQVFTDPGISVPSTAGLLRGTMWLVNARFGVDTDRFCVVPSRVAH